METLIERIQWYRRHQNSVLDYRHRFLADVSDATIERWTRASRRTHLALLDNARDYYEIERNQRNNNQTTIDDWLS